MLLSGDIVSKRGWIEPQITPPPVEITIGIAVPLVEITDIDSYDTIRNKVAELNIPYEIYKDSSTGSEIGSVYYLVSSELSIDEDSLNQILPEKVSINNQDVKPVARYVYDYLVSIGVNFVLAVCLYRGVWTSRIVYTMLQIPFETSSDEKEFLRRDIDFVFAVYPVPHTSDIEDFKQFIGTVSTHVNVCSKKEIPALDETSSSSRIGQLERFFVLGLPPDEIIIGGVYSKVSPYSGAFVRTVLLTSNFTEIYLPDIFGGEAEVSLSVSGGSSASSESGGSSGGGATPTSSLLEEEGGDTGGAKGSDASVYDFTWSLAGLPFVMTYIMGGNLAKPLTGKPIGGITFGGTKVGMSVLSKLYTLYGACLLVADNPSEAPTCYRSNTMAYGIGSYSSSRKYGIEDTEFSLMFVEDTMDKINREFLRAFRGNILNKAMVKIIEERFKRFVLDDYLSKGWILAYRDVKFKQDDKDPTKVVGSYAYMPAYPINKIWVEHFFIL